MSLADAFRAAGFSPAEITFAQECALHAAECLSASSMNIEAAATRFINWTTSPAFRRDVLRPYLAACNPSADGHASSVSDDQRIHAVGGSPSGGGDQPRVVNLDYSSNVSSPGHSSEEARKT